MFGLLYENFHTFFILYLIYYKNPTLMCPQSKKPKIKNLKISEEAHSLLKEYCVENGLKIFAFVEKLIKEKCKTKKDIYGE